VPYSSAGVVYRRSEVFVVGGQPTVTYNPRPAQGVHARVKDYLEERGRILCITGPTKSGKTVLAREVLPKSIRVVGGELASVDDFWADIVDELAAYTSESAETSRSDASASSDSYGGAAKIMGSGVDATHRDADEHVELRKHSQSRTRSVRKVAKAELLKLKVPVVLDDFHHVEPDIQKQVVRGVKDLVFEGVPIVFIAVPHRAADVVRAEREMRGRVEHLQISAWSLEELEDIAERGFAALNIQCPEHISRRMARESYGSPHLMQNFCLQICKANGITETLDDLVWLEGDTDDNFYRWVAEMEGADETFRRLEQGPPRSDRIKRRLSTGEETDIYGAVLRAIASTGPKTELDWTEINTGLRKVLAGNVPKRHEYTRVLEQMSAIARDLVFDSENERFVGDPALDYNPKLGKLHISDPFFAYHLRWTVRRANGTRRGAGRATSEPDAG
jgi:hypothetical protein